MTKSKPLPSLEYLHECFNLSEDSPSGLVWKIRPQSHFTTTSGRNQVNSRFAGKTAGSVWSVPKSDLKYWIVQIAGSHFKVHRVVYALTCGNDLAENTIIDHKDSNGLNNRIEKLRVVSFANNSWNRKMHNTNTSSFKGVHYCKNGKYWIALVVHKGVKTRVRGFQTPESANEEVIKLRKELHKEFARN